jgi:hypothetical protein
MKKKTFKIYCTKCKEITKHDELLDNGRYLKGVICQKCKTNKQQKSLNYFELYPYTKKCTCGNIITLLTQEDSSPEYYTRVRIVCNQCTRLVLFNLPVN